MVETKKNYGLIGFPLEHSFSKSYFESKFQASNINASYHNFPISNCDDLKALISKNKLSGLNVTIPHKQNVIPYLDEMSAEASTIGAVNCIKVINNRLIGFNTDVFGFEKSLVETFDVKNKKAIVFGTGGSSKAIIFVLKKLQIPFTQVSRAKNEHCITYEALGDSIISTHKILINTTPKGMFPQIDECIKIPYALLNESHVAFDLIYNPAKSLFLQQCEHNHAQIKNGHDMLIYQAEESFRLFSSNV
jgi:shikimate dehydrogenase